MKNVKATIVWLTVLAIRIIQWPVDTIGYWAVELSWMLSDLVYISDNWDRYHNRDYSYRPNTPAMYRFLRWASDTAMKVGDLENLDWPRLDTYQTKHGYLYKAAYKVEYWDEEEKRHDDKTVHHTIEVPLVRAKGPVVYPNVHVEGIKASSYDAAESVTTDHYHLIGGGFQQYSRSQ